MISTSTLELIELLCTTRFDSFRAEHVPKEIKTFIDNKNIKTIIFRIQVYDSMGRCFCIGFIDFILEKKTLTGFTNPFSPNNFFLNEEITLNYFMTNI